MGVKPNDNDKNSNQSISGILKERLLVNLAIQDLCRELESKLYSEDGYYVDRNVVWGPTSENLNFDIVIRKDKYIIAIIDSYIGDNRSRLSYFWRGIADNVFEKTQAGLYIKYCVKDKSFLLYDRFDDETDNNYIARVFKDINDVVKAIKQVADAEEKTKSKQISDIISASEKQFDLRFYEEKILDPEWCREQLGSFTDNICRYSTLDSLFSILKYGTFRMNGLPGMNDKDEGLFAWNLIYDSNKMSNDEIKRRKRLINNAFIVSFSREDKIDDLTQWRLYGDDAKGVCCVFSVQKNKIIDRYFLHPIKYIEVSQKGHESSDDLLTQFKKYVENQSDLDYSDLSPVIFYYKHIDYVSEGEVRLLVDNKKTTAYKKPEYKREWLLTNANKIPNPYIDIPLKEFPLKLERIILGPNMNDVDTLQAQLETMLVQQGIDAKVELSNIDSYRNPINR